MENMHIILTIILFIIIFFIIFVTLRPQLASFFEYTANMGGGGVKFDSMSPF